MKFKNHFILLLIIFGLQSCALFKSQDSGNYSKSNSVQNQLVSMDLTPWTTNNSEGTDYTLFNNLTKSYFLFNSACRKNESSNLKTLTTSMFAGIQDVNFLEKTTTTHQERDATLVLASGKVDGVTRYFRVLTTQKNNCIYDFVLIAINQNTLEKDTTDFNSFSQHIILK